MLLIVVIINIHEGNEMRRRTRANFEKTSDTASPMGEFTAVMLFLCGRTGPVLYTLHVAHRIVQRNINYNNQTIVSTRPGGSAHTSMLPNPTHNIIQKIYNSRGGCDLNRTVNNVPRTEVRTTVSHLARLYPRAARALTKK